MIVVTGAAGFIGSNIVADLNQVTDEQICVCDWGCYATPNLSNHRCAANVFDAECTPEQLPGFLDSYKSQITAIIHMGAISSTTERDLDKLSKLNTRFTINLFLWCAANRKRFIYASSASVYGNDSTFWDADGFVHMKDLVPLNDYGRSKLAADAAIAALVESKAVEPPPQWASLRFFNVYGPNEWHKGEQSSIITKNFGVDRIKLFDVRASRDFVYVKDCSLYVLKLLDNPSVSGVFNIGTEQARPFEDIARIMGLDVTYVPIPDALKTQYQFETKASMNKLKYHRLWFPPTSLEDGIQDYTERHLSSGRVYR